MSKTTFEKLGIPYEERDEIFYPVLVAGTEQADIDAGKYGRMWIKYIKEEYPMRYKSLVRFGSLKRGQMKSMKQHTSCLMILRLSG